MNVGHIEGGHAVNALATHAGAVLEGRSVREEPLAQFDAHLAALRASPGLDVVRTPLDRRPCGRLDPDHPLLAAVRLERTALGLDDRLADGSTDANAALARGIPALALGCARGADMHSRSERVEISSIALGVAQLDCVLRRLLEGDR